jgi:hypothetical protein
MPRHSAEHPEVRPISGFEHYGQWQINAPYLKLALKYGLVGPWQGNNNPSIQFDAYCQKRGPKKGLPSIEDFHQTRLMNSNVDGDDEKRLERWLGSEHGMAQINRVVVALEDVPSLRELSDDRLQTIADVAYGMTLDQTWLWNIRLPKVFKWLYTWASEHIPMIDTELYFAFAEEERSMSDGGWAGIDYDSLTVDRISSVLRDYKILLCRHHEQLVELGKRLGHECKLPIPVSPVRILDNLIWMDWYAVKKYAEFQLDGWIEFQSKVKGARNHRILEKGLAFYEGRGFDRSVVSD